MQFRLLQKQQTSLNYSKRVIENEPVQEAFLKEQRTIIFTSKALLEDVLVKKIGLASIQEASRNKIKKELDTLELDAFAFPKNCSQSRQEDTSSRRNQKKKNNNNCGCKKNSGLRSMRLQCKERRIFRL